jgi:CBS-domain-containing membrane protein
MQARDIMQRTVVTVGPEDTLTDAARVLLDHGINAAPVLDAAGVVIGVVGIKDVLRAPHPSGSSTRMVRHTPIAERAAALPRTLVRAVMARGLVSVAPDTPVADVAATLANQGRHPILVLEDGRLLGVIGRADVVRALLEAGEAFGADAAGGTTQ